MQRLRLGYRDRPHPSLYVWRDARRNCWVCRGNGMFEYAQLHPDGTAAGTNWLMCDCWDPQQQVTVRIPGWSVRFLPARLRDSVPF